MRLAGKWLNPALQDPIASGLGFGAATAGAATLGNVVSGEADREGGGRVALEALGAGALGGALGAYMPRLRRNSVDVMRQARDKWKADPNELHGWKPQASHLKGALYGVGGIGGLAAGGLGGQIGGGNANIGNMLGIAGMEQNTIVDPEAYGSSNLRVY
jgi:hypothetical protein